MTVKNSIEKKIDSRTGREYILSKAGNGFKYVKAIPEHGARPILHIAGGNSKTGTNHVLCYGHTIEESCNHSCGCYADKMCYGMQGFYQMYTVNQLYLADNLYYFRVYGWETMADEIIAYLQKKHCKFFRWFTVGDIVNIDFLHMIVKVGKALPHIKFWGYTKKYMLVNHYIEKYFDGNAKAFHNCTGLIFSHWRNNDGSFFEMLNPYKLPTSEFIPLGMEHESEKADHVCPCSNPDIYENCCNCSTPCYELKIGQSMALLEHSTARTSARDKAVKKAHEAIKNGAKKPAVKSKPMAAKKTSKKAVKPAKKAATISNTGKAKKAARMPKKAVKTTK